MTLINQKHGVPKVAGGQTFSMSRGKFLDGTIKTYYGPGQPPNAAPENGITLADGTEDLLAYTPPTDWPSAGSILRVPQCVYLSALVMDYNHPLPYRLTQHEFSIFEEPLTYDHSIPPIYHDEYVRLKSVFDDTVTAIESLRPNRTWVQNVDWLPADFEQPHGSNNHYALRDQGILSMLAPPADADPDHPTPYFGVNFLHVYAGSKCSDKSPFVFPFHQYHRYLPDDLDTAPEDDFDYQRTLLRLQAAYPKFAGYSAKLYGLDLPYDPYPPWVNSVLQPPYIGNISLQSELDINNANMRVSIEGTNAGFLQIRDRSNAFLSASSALLEGHGFSYDGVTSDLTAVSLVALIAAHYGFDPVTGKDLG